MPGRTPTISIVTGTWDRRASLLRLVRAVADRTDVPWELIIADCSEKPFRDSDFLAHGGRVRVLDDRPKTSMIEGYRRAFDACTGTWVLWLNDDAEPMPGYARAAITFMERYPQIGLGALYYSEGPPPNPWRVNSFRGSIYANFGILRRDLGAELGWFNCGAMRMYGSDNALAFKVLLAGFGVVGIPGAYVVHHAVPDRQKQQNQAMRGTDPDILLDRFSRCLPLIQSTYEQHAHLQGPTTINSSEYAGRFA